MSTLLRGSTLGQYSSVHIALIALKTHLLGSKAASSEHTIAIKFHVSFVFVTHSYGGVGELRRE